MQLMMGMVMMLPLASTSWMISSGGRRYVMAGVDAGGGSRGVVCVLFMVLCGSQLVLNASYFMEAITEENNKVHDHTSKNVKAISFGCKKLSLGT
jgi:hypothetical protein